MSLKYKGTTIVGGGGGQDLTAGDGLNKVGNTLNLDLPTKSISEAEYNALSEEEKLADVLYLVNEPDWVSVPLSIQEYDTEDGWHVRKWSNGYIEMSIQKAVDVTGFSNSSTGARFAHLADSIELPISLLIKFSERAEILENTAGADLWVGTKKTQGTALTATNAYAVYTSSSSVNSANGLKFSIVVAGRWK